MKKQEKNNNRRSQRDYSLAFKLQVVQQVEKGELTKKVSYIALGRYQSPDSSLLYLVSIKK